jgi:NitT/TauT family transport system substrate-binding protein
MMNANCFPRVCVATTLILLYAACGRRGGSSAGSEVRIAAGSTSDIVYLPTTLAQRLGHFEAEGLKVTITDTAAGSKSLEALLGGSVDVVTGFYDHAIQMAAEGRAIKAFVLLARYPGAVAVISPEGKKKIQKIEDLRKATVGVTAPGSSSHFFLNYLLTTHNVPFSDVGIVAIGGGAGRVSAIERSKVDAGILYEPGVTRLMHRAPAAAILADTRTAEGVRSIFGTESYPSSVLYTKDSWLDQNRETARRLVRAMVRTLHWIQEHSAEQVADKMPPEFRGDDPGIYVEALRNSMQIFSPDGVMDARGAEAVRKVLAVSSEKVRNGQIDISKTFTNEFLERSKK